MGRANGVSIYAIGILVRRQLVVVACATTHVMSCGLINHLTHDHQCTCFYFHRPEDETSQEFRRQLQHQPDAAAGVKSNNNSNRNSSKVETAPRKQDVGGGQEKKKQTPPPIMIKWELVAPLMVFLIIGWRVWSTKQTFVRKGLHKKHESDMA
jgi:hypothetical protein